MRKIHYASLRFIDNDTAGQFARFVNRRPDREQVSAIKKHPEVPVVEFSAPLARIKNFKARNAHLLES